MYKMHPIWTNKKGGLVKRADSLILPLIKELGIEEGVRLAEIKKHWYDLFNEPLSYHMSPSKLSGGEILLNVDSPVWLHELNFFKEEIFKKLSSYGVKSVRFRLGRTSIRGKSKNRPQSAGSVIKPLRDDEISYIKETVSLIHDQELRDKVRKAIEKAIISGRTKQ